MWRRLFPNIAAKWDAADEGERTAAPVIFFLCFTLAVTFGADVLDALGFGP